MKAHGKYDLVGASSFEGCLEGAGLVNFMFQNCG